MFNSCENLHGDFRAILNKGESPSTSVFPVFYDSVNYHCPYGVALGKYQNLSGTDYNSLKYKADRVKKGFDFF